MAEHGQHSPDTPDREHTDPFYVGYRPAPSEHRRAMKSFIILLALWLSMMGCVLVLTQRDPGDAVWDISNERTWSGTLVEHPYPMLIPDDPATTSAMFVVAMGKRGAQDRLSAGYGHRVTLRGYELQREGRRMIELAESPDTIQIGQPAAAQPAPATTPSESPIELVGEIIDGKCYLGAMKPGDGFGHRACAMLCLRGGLPPMFVAEGETGRTLYPLLIVDNSTQLDESTMSKVARRVRLRARTATIAGLPVLYTSAQEIELADDFIGHPQPGAP